MSIQVGSGLRPETRLFRYMSLEAFIGYVETGMTTLANVNTWPDKWEAILSKLPVVDGEGRIEPVLYSFYQLLFGQCWSAVEESDAMWRIYSPSSTGVRIESSVANFERIRGIQRGLLSRVEYFDSIDDLLRHPARNKTPFDDAIFKRAAFSYEQEVRLLTHSDFLDTPQPRAKYIQMPLDPVDFLEGITIDPRAENWYVSAIGRYCLRAGLSPVPIRSALYEADPHLKVGIVRRYVPVKATNNASVRDDDGP